MMEYIYEIFVDGVRRDTSVRWESFEKEFTHLQDSYPLGRVTYEIKGANGFFSSGSDIEAEREGRERAYTWKPTLPPVVDFFDDYALKHSGLGGRIAHKEYNITAIEGDAPQPQPDAINPSHYKDVVPGMQYMELMQYMLKGFDGVESHLLGQVYKYLMRLKKKDPVEQDSSKALWYLEELVKYYKTGSIDLKGK